MRRILNFLLVIIMLFAITLIVLVFVDDGLILDTAYSKISSFVQEIFEKEENEQNVFSDSNQDLPSELFSSEIDDEIAQKPLFTQYKKIQMSHFPEWLNGVWYSDNTGFGKQREFYLIISSQDWISIESTFADGYKGTSLYSSMVDKLKDTDGKTDFKVTDTSMYISVEISEIDREIFEFEKTSDNTIFYSQKFYKDEKLYHKIEHELTLKEDSKYPLVITKYPEWLVGTWLLKKTVDNKDYLCYFNFNSYGDCNTSAMDNFATLGITSSHLPFGLTIDNKGYFTEITTQDNFMRFNYILSDGNIPCRFEIQRNGNDVEISLYVNQKAVLLKEKLIKN